MARRPRLGLRNSGVWLSGRGGYRESPGASRTCTASRTGSGSPRPRLARSTRSLRRALPGFLRPALGALDGVHTVRRMRFCALASLASARATAGSLHDQRCGADLLYRYTEDRPSSPSSWTTFTSPMPLLRPPHVRRRQLARGRPGHHPPQCLRGPSRADHHRAAGRCSIRGLDQLHPIAAHRLGDSGVRRPGSAPPSRDQQQPLRAASSCAPQTSM